MRYATKTITVWECIVQHDSEILTRHRLKGYCKIKSTWNCMWKCKGWKTIERTFDRKVENWSEREDIAHKITLEEGNDNRQFESSKSCH